MKFHVKSDDKSRYLNRKRLCNKYQDFTKTKILITDLCNIFYIRLLCKSSSTNSVATCGQTGGDEANRHFMQRFVAKTPGQHDGGYCVSTL